MTREEVLAILQDTPEGTKIVVAAVQYGMEMRGTGVLLVGSTEDEFFLRLSPSVIQPFFGDGVEYISIDVPREQSQAPHRRLARLRKEDAERVQEEAVRPRNEARRPNPAQAMTATTPAEVPRDDSAVLNALSAITERLCRLEAHRAQPPAVTQPQVAQTPVAQHTRPSAEVAEESVFDALNFAQAVGQAHRGITRPLWTIAGNQLSLVSNLDLPWRVFSVPHYCGLRSGDPSADRWMTDYAIAKSTLLPVVTAFGQHDKDSKSAMATLDTLHMELSMMERALETLIAATAKDTPATKQAWLPAFMLSFKVLSLLSTLKFGFVQGHQRTIKSFAKQWSNGNIDLEQVWNNDNKTFR